MVITYKINSISQWGKILVTVKFIRSEGHKILRNLHLRFVVCSNGQIYGRDFEKFCGLLRIYEL